MQEYFQTLTNAITCNTCIAFIVRIEFSPVVEIGASNGHNLLPETTYKELALTCS